VREEAGAVVAMDGEGEGDGGEGGEDVVEAPTGEEASAVGGYLEACLWGGVSGRWGRGRGGGLTPTSWSSRTVSRTVTV
jgi:hypothetical protein